MPFPTIRPMGYAAPDLGLSQGLGQGLASQVVDQNEEERRKRLARQQQLTLLGPAAMALGLNGDGSIGA